MMRARRLAGAAPTGSIVVRLVDSGGKVMGFVRQVDDGEEADAVFPSELKPVEDVLRLAESKQRETPGSTIWVELEAGLRWREEWGSLED